MSDALTEATAVLRAISGDDHDRAAATRLRLRRALEQRAHGRRRLTSIGLVIGLLFGATSAWALATGKAARVWSAIAGEPTLPEREAPAIAAVHREPTAASEPIVAPEPTVASEPIVTPPAPRAPEPAAASEPIVAPPTTPAAQPTAASEPIVAPTTPALPTPIVALPAPRAPEPTATTIVAPTTPAPRAPIVAPTTPSPRAQIVAPPTTTAPRAPASRTSRPQVEPPAAPAIEVLYRRAHELHFRGGDPAAAIAAWDAYLSAEPAGRFAVEARYNRALLWIRVGRYREAHAALVPFARGEVTPAGYRQEEAEKLVARLARLNDPSPSGHHAP